MRTGDWQAFRHAVARACEEIFEVYPGADFDGITVDRDHMDIRVSLRLHFLRLGEDRRAGQRPLIRTLTFPDHSAIGRYLIWVANTPHAVREVESTVFTVASQAWENLRMRRAWQQLHVRLIERPVSLPTNAELREEIRPHSPSPENNRYAELLAEFERNYREHFSAQLDEQFARATTGTTYTTEGRPNLAESNTLSYETIRRAQEALQFPRRAEEDERTRRLRALEAAQAEAARDAAQARGMALLRENLTPAQLAQYDEHRFFDVVGSATGKRYRIHHGRQQNIHELDKAGRPVQGWCFLVAGNLVEGDVMLAQKLGLELEEEKVLNVAVKFTVTQGHSLRYLEINGIALPRNAPNRHWFSSDY